MKRFLLPFLFLIGLSPLCAQDFHYTLFNMAPLSLNPALTGAFPGTVRIGGIYRDQWGLGYLSEQFRTPSFYADAPILQGIGKLDWIGVGGMFLSDQAGRAGFSSTQFMASVSYHLSLNKTRTTVLTLGVSLGSIQRRLDISAGNSSFFFGDELERVIGTNNDPLTDGNDRAMMNPNESGFDLNAGLLFRRTFSPKTMLEVGFAINHLTRPDIGVLTADPNVMDNQGNQLNFTYLAHANLSLAFTDQLSLTPSVFFQTVQGGGSNTSIQALVGYKLNPQQDITLSLGPGYRIGDAGQVIAGVDWKSLRVRASYDITFSSLANTSGNQGSLEVAAYYILALSKRPQVPPAILCPHF